MSIAFRACKTTFTKRFNKAFIITFKRSFMLRSHTKRLFLPSHQYILHWTFSGSRFFNGIGSLNNTTPREVSHEEIIASIIQQKESRISKSKKRKAKDIKEDEIKELLIKAGINYTDKRVYEAHRKLLLLEKGGCSVEKVVNCPYVITLTHNQLLDAIKSLKQLGFEVLYPELILKVNDNTIKLKQITDDWICEKFGFSERRELVQAVLNLTTDEFYKHGSKSKYFQSISGIPIFLKKVHILLKFNFTLEQIKGNLWMLEYSVKELQKRIIYFKTLAPGVKLEPSIIRQVKTTTIECSTVSEELKDVDNQNDLDLDLKDDKYMKYKLCTDNFEVVVKMLDIDLEHVTKFHFIEKMQRKLLVQKLQFLLDHNIPANDIINHIYCLTFRSIKRMKEVVEVTKKAGVHRLSIKHILNLPANKKFPRFTKRLVFHKELAVLLNISVYDVQLFGLPDSWQADRIKMKENFDFLLEQGFSIDHIKSCPLLLGHSGNTLQVYFEKLKNHQDLNSFEDIRNDKHRLLNALQYFIEKDFEFSGVVTPLKKRLSYKSLN